mgnify:CR=1 FL=1
MDEFCPPVVKSCELVSSGLPSKRNQGSAFLQKSVLQSTDLSTFLGNEIFRFSQRYMYARIASAQF